MEKAPCKSNQNPITMTKTMKATKASKTITKIPIVKSKVISVEVKASAPNEIKYYKISILTVMIANYHNRKRISYKYN
jgi:hypothetical protein